ncbi:MAG: type IX secretion system protein PorQ [Bacteroidia bacterium]|nr:type IX secretion system protein PorQ [Bacteroidia bacterium]
MRNLRLFVTCFFLGTFFSFKAQTGGDNTFEFLNLTLSARSCALGGYTLPTKDDDINLVYDNPSVLSNRLHNQLSLSYINYFGDVNYGYTAYAREFKKVGTFAAGLMYADYGKFKETDVTGEVTGSFFASDYCFHISYARPLDSMFSVGASLKTIYSVYEDYWSGGNVIDLSAIYSRESKNFTAAVIIKNIGRQWKGYTPGVIEPMPFEIQAGITKKPKHAPFRMSLILTHLEKWDLTYTDPANPPVTEDPITGEPLKERKLAKFTDKAMRHLHVSTEMILTKNFHIRLAYNYRRRKELLTETKPGLVGFSFGFGMKINRFQISYGHGNYHLAGGTNNFTITTNLADFIRKPSI